MSYSSVTQNFNASECPFSGPNCTYGAYLAYDACFNLIKPAVGGGDNAKERVAQCILSYLTEYEKVVWGTAQYNFTLWPAIVGIIGAFGPDAADIACDNLWWAALYAVTSGALPGQRNLNPSHHIEVDTADKGDTICREFEFVSDRTTFDVLTVNRANSRILTGYRNKSSRNNDRKQAKKFLEWVFFLLGLAVYLAFNVQFGISLRKTILFGFKSPFVAGVWYWLAAMPATLAIFAEIILDRVDLYESVSNNALIGGGKEGQAAMNTSVAQMNKPSLQVASAMPYPVNVALASEMSRQTYTTSGYQKVTDFRVRFFSKWVRILRHQWHRRAEYRVLVHPYSPRWYFQVWNLIVGLVRFTIFALGSILMGNLLLYHVGQDTVSFVLIVVATAVPRVTWSESWIHGAGGADLVVWIRPTDMDDY